jgi:hypothetical protein
MSDPHNDPTSPGTDDAVASDAPSRPVRKRRLTGPLRNGNVRRGVKYATALATIATAGYGALRPEDAAQRAIIENRVLYEHQSKKVAALQSWARSNREKAETALTKCEAKVAAIETYIAGYLLALSRMPIRRHRPEADSTSKAVKGLLQTMAKKQGAAAKPSVQVHRLPALRRPKEIKQLLQKKR